MARQALASTATTATPNSGPRYDIFINHRGPDVKKNFASHLSNLFDLCKLRAFLDQDSLQVGEKVDSQIEVAIATASVHIAIFSPREGWFARFVRKLAWGTKGKDGTYAEALCHLERSVTYDAQTRREKPKYEGSTIEKWRDALSRVANISGLELEECNRDEGELAYKIVQRVKELLKEKESRKGMKVFWLRILCNGGSPKKIKARMGAGQ